MREPPTKLEPCPFCGGSLLTTEDNGDIDYLHFWIACHGCESEGPWRTSPEDAAEGWNRRHAANNYPKAIEALREARGLVDVVAGENRPSVKWARELRDDIDAILSQAEEKTE